MPRTVSEAAVFARLKRKLLREEGLFLHRCPGRSRWRDQLGRYYTSNERNHIAGYSSDSLETLARERGVLHDDEQLIE